MNSLMNSMCLVLDEFYKNLKVRIILVLIPRQQHLRPFSRLLECRVLLETALMNSWPLLRPHARNTKSVQIPLLTAAALRTLHREYIPELQRARAQREKTLQRAKDENMTRVLKDLAIDREKNPAGALDDRWDPDEEDDDDGDINIIDRCEPMTNLSRGFLNTDSPSYSGRKGPRRIYRRHSRSATGNRRYKLAKTWLKSVPPFPPFSGGFRLFRRLMIFNLFTCKFGSRKQGYRNVPCTLSLASHLVPDCCHCGPM